MMIKLISAAIPNDKQKPGHAWMLKTASKALIAMTLSVPIFQSCQKEEIKTNEESDEKEIVFDKIFNPTDTYFELIESEVDLEGAKTIKVNDTEQCKWFGMYPEGETAKEIHFEFKDDGSEASLAGVNNSGYIKGLDKPAKALFIIGELENKKVVIEDKKVYLELIIKDDRYCINIKAMIYLGEEGKIYQEEIEKSVIRIEENNLSINEGA